MILLLDHMPVSQNLTSPTGVGSASEAGFQSIVAYFAQTVRAGYNVEVIILSVRSVYKGAERRTHNITVLDVGCSDFIRR